MLDGAQRAPHGPLDLPALGIDFYVFAGHKAYGPTASACCGPRPSCSTPCRRSMAAAR
jgi:cysteine desulfurase/selenocysteine lyase